MGVSAGLTWALWCLLVKEPESQHWLSQPRVRTAGSWFPANPIPRAVRRGLGLLSCTVVSPE